VTQQVREQLSSCLADAAADGCMLQQLQSEVEGVTAERQRAAAELVLSKAAVDAERMRGVCVCACVEGGGGGGGGEG